MKILDFNQEMNRDHYTLPNPLTQLILVKVGQTQTDPKKNMGFD